MKTISDAISAEIVGVVNPTLPLHRFAYEYANCKSRHAAALLVYSYDKKIVIDENETTEIRDQLVQLKIILTSLSPLIEADLNIVLVGRVLLSKPLLGLQLIPSLTNPEMLSNTLGRMLQSVDRIAVWTALCASELIDDIQIIQPFLQHSDISIRKRALMNLPSNDLDSLLQSVGSLELLPVLVDLFIRADDSALPRNDLYRWSSDLLTKLCEFKERDSLLIVKLLKLLKKSGESLDEIPLDVLCTRSEAEIRYELATMTSSAATDDMLLDSFICASEPKTFDEFVTRKWLERESEERSPGEYFELAKKYVPFALNVHSKDFQTFLIDSLRMKCGEEGVNAFKALLPPEYKVEPCDLSKVQSFEEASELLREWTNAPLTE